jgi:hypothetical protein
LTSAAQSPPLLSATIVFFSVIEPPVLLMPPDLLSAIVEFSMVAVASVLTNPVAPPCATVELRITSVDPGFRLMPDPDVARVESSIVTLAPGTFVSSFAPRASIAGKPSPPAPVMYTFLNFTETPVSTSSSSSTVVWSEPLMSAAAPFTFAASAGPSIVSRPVLLTILSGSVGS